MERKTFVELLRFYSAIIIIIHHFFLYLVKDSALTYNTLAITVEFFLILSGYLMMEHASKNEESDIFGLTYTWKKYKSLFLPVFTASLFHFTARCIVQKINTPVEIFKNFWHLKWDFLMLQNAGFIQNPQFNKDFLNGTFWYISSVIIATPFTYSLAKHCKKIFINFIAPLSVLLTYCYFTQTYNTVNGGTNFIFNSVLAANFRAFAGLNLGCIVHQITKKLIEKNYTASLGFNLASLISLLMIPGLLIYSFFTKDQNSIFMLIPFSIIIIDSFANITVFIKWLNSICKKQFCFLGKWSLFIYIGHFTIIYILKNYFSKQNLWLLFVICITISLIYSLLLMGLVNLLKRIFSKIKISN